MTERNLLAVLPALTLALAIHAGFAAPGANAETRVPVEYSDAGSPLVGDFPFSAAVR